MTGFEIFLCWLAIGGLFTIYFTIKWCENPTFVRVCKYLGGGIFCSILPAIILAWSTRNILPNVYQIHNNRYDSGVRYCFFHDPYSGYELELTENYITNASNDTIYVIKVRYADNYLEERPESELIYELAPNSTVKSDLYIGQVFPEFISRTRSVTKSRKKIKRHYRLDSEIIILKQDDYINEMNRARKERSNFYNYYHF